MLFKCILRSMKTLFQNSLDVLLFSCVGQLAVPHWSVISAKFLLTLQKRVIEFTVKLYVTYIMASRTPYFSLKKRRKLAKLIPFNSMTKTPPFIN